MPDTIIKLHERHLESLNSIGFAIQHFPDYHASDVSVLHGHDILEINYIAGGSALHRIGDMKKVCSPGSLGIIHYGQKHNLSCPDGADVINLYLDTVNHKLPDVPAKFADVIRTLFPPSDLPGMPPVAKYWTSRLVLVSTTSVISIESSNKSTIAHRDSTEAIKQKYWISPYLDRKQLGKI